MNSQLYNKKYKVPHSIIKKLNVLIYNADDNSDGIKRAKFLVKNGYCTYQMLKGLKNFFDHYNSKKNTPEQYELSGGDDMKIWVERTLSNERKRTELSSKNRQGVDVKKTTGIHTLGAQSGIVDLSLKMTEDYKSENHFIADIVDYRINEEVDGFIGEITKGIKHNVIAVIYNTDGNVLLAKRSPEKDQWMPDKWALVGGGVEDGEKPEDAIKREVWEETGLELDNFNKSFVVDLPNSKLHVFTAFYNGDLYDIQLNNENTAYGWYSIPEMEYIDTVPNLVLYVSNALTKLNV